ncbi:MAG: hypothetical protein IT318_24895 [Anaerolineales bacterium]|nr:hypothetical protein [Anaerolineales bacterium]
MITIDFRFIQLDSAWRACAFDYVLTNDGAGAMTLTKGGVHVDGTHQADVYPEEGWHLIGEFFSAAADESARRMRQAGS